MIRLEEMEFWIKGLLDFWINGFFLDHWIFLDQWIFSDQWIFLDQGIIGFYLENVGF